MEESFFLLRISLCIIVLILIRGRRALKLQRSLFSSFDGGWIIAEIISLALPIGSFGDNILDLCFTIVFSAHLFVWINCAERRLRGWSYVLCAAILMERSFFAVLKGKLHILLFVFAFRILWVTTGITNSTRSVKNKLEIV
jgi:hypothetical protein